MEKLKAIGVLILFIILAIGGFFFDYWATSIKAELWRWVWGLSFSGQVAYFVGVSVLVGMALWATRKK